ncbi:MAG: hypothetical protein AAFU03_16900, partial [Bacteroidota bacterium]
MRNLRATRALLAAQWEIDFMYGLRYLTEYMEFDASTHEAKPHAFILSGGVYGSGQEVESYNEEFERASVAHLLLSGAMRLEDGACGAPGIRSLSQMIAAADANPTINGILLEVNSGGGESEAGSYLQNALRDVSSNGNTPVIVYAQTLASAAVRGTLPANLILASRNTSNIGSIGTMVPVDLEALKWLQENTMDLYARQSTLKNKEYRALLEGDYEPLIDFASNNAQEFIDEVEAARPGMRRTAEQAERMRAGELFIAKEAAEFGLIDGITTFQGALSQLTNL